MVEKEQLDELRAQHSQMKERNHKLLLTTNEWRGRVSAAEAKAEEDREAGRRQIEELEEQVRPTSCHRRK